MLQHIPVLLKETIQFLNIQPNGRYIDCTFGCGGHTQAIMNLLSSQGQLLAFDRDPCSLLYAQNIIHQNNFIFIHDKFSNIHLHCQHLIGQVDGILLDLGPSSLQLDSAERGFSFKHMGPIDMRMNPNEGETALDIIKKSSIEHLAQIIYELSDEKKAYKIAKNIKAFQHKLYTTEQLSHLIEQTIGKTEKKHPATRVFQALRIYVNQELQELVSVLPRAYDLLKPGGIMCVISFHSIEDRIVKRFMQHKVRSIIPHVSLVHSKQAHFVARIIRPTRQEILSNRRSRSAILRVLQKIS